MAEVYGYLKSY